MTIGLISVDGQPGQQKKYVQSLYLGGISEREEGGDSGGAFWRHQEAERVRAASDRCGHWWFTLLAKTCLWLENAPASPENGAACSWSRSGSSEK